jgi:hypothetical protein
MSKKYLLRSAFGSLFALASVALSSCGGDYAIFVRVAGAPQETTGLYVTAKLGETYAGKGMDIAPPQPMDMVGIRLPSDKSGMLTVEVSALGSDQCKAAAGSVQVDLGKGRAQEVTVNLAALNPRVCSLILNPTGEGTVNATPAGTPCGAGCYDYKKDSSVVLSFNATGKSYGAQVHVSSGGVCDGYNDCSVKVSKRVTVDAKFQPRLCSLSKWCWYHPLPQGNILRGVFGTSDSDVWAVGDGGTAMHYNGTQWSLAPTGTSSFLRGVWGNASNRLWAVGDMGTVLRWNGSNFTKETSGTLVNLNTVWGSSETNLYAGGMNGVIIRSGGGGSWNTESSGTTVEIKRISGTDAKNVWAVAGSTTILSSAGSGWSSQTQSSLSSVSDVLVLGVNDVWAGGGPCKLGRWDGTIWKFLSASPTYCSIGNVVLAGSGPGDVWAAADRKGLGQYASGDPTKETAVDLLASGNLVGTPATFNAAWSGGPGDVHLVTSQGNIMRRVGSTGGTQVSGPLPLVYPRRGGSEVFIAAGNATTEYILLDDGTIFTSDGRKLNYLSGVPGGLVSSFDAWAPQSENTLLVASSSGTVYRYVGGNWSAATLPSTSSSLFAIGGISSSDYYVGSSTGYIYRFANGITPSSAINPTAYTGAMQSIWGRTSSEVWACGNGGVTVKINQGTPTKILNPAPVATALYAIHGPPSPSSHVWSVGQGGYVMKTVDGSNWITVPSGVSVDLNSVVALSETDIWIAGDGGVLLHWDDAQKKLVQVAGPFAARNLHKLHSPAPNDIWLVGGADGVWRYMP